MRENKLVCIAGMAGSGKSVVSDYFANKGYQFVRFGQITLDIVKERGLTPNEENEKQVREEVRRKYGMGAYATLNLPKFKDLLKKGNVVADGLYSFSEYKRLKEEFGKKMIVIAVYAPPELRYERISKRVSGKDDKAIRNRPFTKAEAKERDYAEIENIEKGGPIAMADYTLLNIGSQKNLENELEKLFDKLESK